MDKSVETFEQNKHFLLASFRNLKKTSYLSMLQYAPWTLYVVTTLKRGEGVEISKLEIEKLAHKTKRVFFGECLNCFCQWL